jgi:uncharacterized protein YjbI with pentapeptide repeats
MANQKQLGILKQGIDVWNRWRKDNSDTKIDLNHADLRKAKLKGVNFFRAHLIEANLSEADLRRAMLRGANLDRADLRQAELNEADLHLAFLRQADLTEAYLYQANLWATDLTGANLTSANLTSANLTSANLTNANLTSADLTNSNLIEAKTHNAKISKSRIYGVNVWGLKGDFEEEKDLIITPHKVPSITVDNIKIAQFLYLILNNEEIRDVINTLTSKSVLLLGRFALPERKAILDALRNKLREYNLLPIVFDFDRPTDKDFTETIKTLAGLCYFVVADVTNPKSSPLELQATVPDYQIPFVPIIQEGEQPFAMMVDLQKKYNWVLKTVTYDSVETLIKVLKPLIIDPAMNKRNELRLTKAQVPEVISGKDYLAKGDA